MRYRLILAFASAVALSACAANYPDLMTGAAPPAADPNRPGELDLILYQATVLQRSYASNYKTTAKWQDYGQLPIIGAAGYAAWVLLNNKVNAATKVGKIGIVAGVYSEARSQLSAPGLTDAYIAGHAALTCVLAEGSMFTGQVAQDRQQELDDQLQLIANRIGEVNALRYFEPADAAKHAEALRTARTVADLALTNARAAESAALAQQAEFKEAPSTFRNAVSSISSLVASKGRVRPPPSTFDDYRKKFAPAKTATEGSAQGAGDRAVKTDAASIVAQLSNATRLLVTETAQLSEGTPDYAGSRLRVKACPEMVR